MLIDTHCHLYFDNFAADLPAVLANMAAAGVAGAVVVGVDVETNGQAQALAREHGSLKYSAGMHPAYEIPSEYWRAGTFDADAFLRPWWDQAQQPVAVGECGIDLHWNVSPLEAQHAVFTAQLRWARERGLPVIVHTRDADVETHAALCEVPGARGILHCFNGSALLLEYALANGWFISFAGNLTFPKAQLLRDAAAATPVEHLLVETDAPFLAPQEFRGKRCEPAHAASTARVLAGIKGLTEYEMDAVLRANAERCYNTRW